MGTYGRMQAWRVAAAASMRSSTTQTSSRGFHASPPRRPRSAGQRQDGPAHARRALAQERWAAIPSTSSLPHSWRPQQPLARVDLPFSFIPQSVELPTPIRSLACAVSTGHTSTHVACSPHLPPPMFNCTGTFEAGCEAHTAPFFRNGTNVGPFVAAVSGLASQKTCNAASYIAN